MARPLRRLGPEDLASLGDEELLDLQFRELDLRIEGTDLATADRAAERRAGQRAASLFRPHFWLSDEWFTPDGIPGVAIPFYLAHPRLAKLELAQMLEVEGGDHDWCMRILRHEAGHAIDNAFHLRRRQKRRELFGAHKLALSGALHAEAVLEELRAPPRLRGTRRAIPTKTSPRRSRCG